MAHFSKDEGLLNAFEHKVDLHGNTAKLMFRLDCDANEVKKKYPKFRKMGKVIAFLLQYGGSVMALESTLNSDGMLTEMLQELKEYKHKKDLPDTLTPFWGCKSTKEMAQALMDLYFEAFPGIAKFMKRQKKYAHQHGKVYTVLGRERRLPQIQSSNYREVGYAERLALNAPIQGCQTYDTPILTTKGYKQISELDITKDVLVTHTGVTDDYNVYKTGDKEVYKLTTLNTIQKVTLDHRFCVYDNGELIFKRLKELQPGDYIVSVMDRHSTSYAPINLCKDVAQLTYDENLHLQGKDCALRRKLYTKGGSLSSCLHLLQLCTSSKAQQLLDLIKSITFTKIVKTEYLGVLPTMDIEIFTEDHSYIASGLLNHNSGADIMINAQINIAKNERLKELGCKMLVQIHDELLFSCPKENCDEAIKEIRECMIYPFGRDKLLNLALDIGASHGDSYACGH